MGGGDGLAVVYGLVRFEPGPGRMVRHVLVTFESAQAADLFAIENGWPDYQVTPIHFLVDQVPAPTASTGSAR